MANKVDLSPEEIVQLAVEACQNIDTRKIIDDVLFGVCTKLLIDGVLLGDMTAQRMKRAMAIALATELLKVGQAPG